MESGENDRLELHLIQNYITQDISQVEIISVTKISSEQTEYNILVGDEHVRIVLWNN